MARNQPRESDRGPGRPPPRKGRGAPPPPPPPEPKRRSTLRNTVLIALVWALFAGGVVFMHWLHDLPDVDNLLAYQPGNDITLLDVKGRLLARRGLTQGASVGVSDLPPYVGNAFIAVEDRRFRYHFGIDPLGLGRAFVIDLMHGSFVQGGSTLTQQLAKNLFLKPDRTIKRKAEEAILALYLETRYSKDQILALYLNHVYFGAGVFGIEAASERFFGKSARDLSLSEAAILAGSVKAPSRYNPQASSDAAIARASLVLDDMADASFITPAQRQNAAATRPKIVQSQATPGAGYFIDYAVSQVPAFAGKSNERLIVETTLDLDLQDKAEQAVSAGLVKEGDTLAAHEGALVAMTPDGALKAMVGGRSYDESSFNRATDAMRQPGSAFKAFVYLAALEHGHQPSDLIEDGPVTIGKWAPGNYESDYEGTITLAKALAHSSNSASIQLTREVGPAAVARVAHRLGIASQLHAVPSLALGTSEVTPLELTAAYAAFANGGNGVIPYTIVRIKTGSGKVLYERKGSGLGRVMSAENDAQMTRMMIGTVTEGTGKAAALDDREIAGKTGTSQDYRDAWFVGFSTDYVTSVWIGNDDGKPMQKATGGGLPARIFKNFMTDAEHGLPPAALPGQKLVIAGVDTVPNDDSGTADDKATSDRPDDDKPDNKDDVLNKFQNLLDTLF